MILPTPLLPTNPNLIIPIPNGYRRMIPQSDDIINHLLPDILIDLLSARIHRTRKHQIMPNQQSILIAQVIEDVMVELTASPNPQHIEVAEDSGLDGFVVD